MNCARYQAQIGGHPSEIFEQLCSAILDVCEKNQTSAFHSSGQKVIEKLFGLAHPVFASIQHLCSGGLEHSAHALTLFMVHCNIFCLAVALC